MGRTGGAAEDLEGQQKSSARDPFKTLCDTQEQLASDLSLFKEIVSEKIQDERHEDLLGLAEEMASKLDEFVKLGNSYVDTNVQPETLYKMSEATTELTELMIPPKVFGGYCPCFKPKRSGPDYDRRFYSAESKIILTTFLCHAAVIDHSAELMNDDSAYYSSISKKMNGVFNTLSEIKTQGNDKIREKAKNELAAACDVVNRFVKTHFGEDADQQEFNADATRRILQTNELLTSRSHSEGMPGVEPGSAGGPGSGKGGSSSGSSTAISRRILVKAQSSLQEVMNSAAAICLGKAKAANRQLDDLSEQLNASYEKASKSLGGLRKRMKEATLGDLLVRQKDDCENAFNDANRKIEDASKRWNTVAAQSKTRPVAEYDEDDFPERKSNSNSIGVADLKDPGKLMVKTGKSMQKGVTGGKAVMKDVLKTAVGIGQLIGEDLRSLTGGGGGDSPTSGSSKPKAAKKRPQS